MIFYNGSTGSLGRYLSDAAKSASSDAVSLKSRLEDQEGLHRELTGLFSKLDAGSEVCLLQLAAFVSVPDCEKDPVKARKINVEYTRSTVATFISCARDFFLKPKIVYVSSGHLYAPKDGKILETDLLKPRSVYAQTKLEGELALTEICGTEHTPLIIARVFGLIAPKQPPHYVLQSIIRRAREKNLKDVPGLSNLRDYLDSRDVCSVLVELATVEVRHLEIVNVCSGEGVPIRELLEIALKEVHPHEYDSLCSQLTEGASRPDDIAQIIGDCSRLRELTGDNPKTISLVQTVRDALAC